MKTTITIDGVELQIPQGCPLFEYAKNNKGEYEWYFSLETGRLLLIRTNKEHLHLIAAFAIEWLWKIPVIENSSIDRLDVIRNWEHFTLKPEKKGN